MALISEKLEYKKTAIRAGIFIPETRRYYLTSHSGLWRLCRYSLVPAVLANSTAARNFTTLSVTNLTLANQLRVRESSATYVADAIDSIELPDPIVEIDNQLRRALFAYWVRDNGGAEFRRLKATYKRLDAVELAAAVQQLQQQQVGATTSRATAARQQMMLDPTDVVVSECGVGRSGTHRRKM